jgi:predicted PurR-regulated permease PerM
MVASLLTSRSTSDEESRIEERIRTLSQAICALGVVCYALYALRSIAIPLVLAIALKHCLAPIINFLSVRPLDCCGVRIGARHPRGAGNSCCSAIGRARLPHWLAVVLALALAFTVLGLLGFIVADSINVFARKAPLYADRVQVLAASLLTKLDEVKAQMLEATTDAAAPAPVATNSTEAAAHLADLARSVPVTKLILSVLSSLLDALSNLLLVMLFTVYLLLSPQAPLPAVLPTTATGGRAEAEPPAEAPAEEEAEVRRHARTEARSRAEADAQINASVELYIRGKVLISLMVGTLTAAALGALGVDLWLVFGILAFWLNFIPNVGTLLAVMLPMPLVLLDERFSPGAMVLAFVLPLSAHFLGGSVIEPILFGSKLKLHPVVILCGLLLWASLWGITGMVLAVPLTAVIRIRLAAVQHPLTQFLASVLVGEGEALGGGGGGSNPTSPAARLAGGASPRRFDEGRLPLMAEEGARPAGSSSKMVEMLPIPDHAAPVAVPSEPAAAGKAEGGAPPV